MEKLKNKSILDYKDGIYELQYDLNSDEKKITSVSFELLLRPFKFFSESFEDIEYAGNSCMPIFLAFLIASGNKEEDMFTIEDTKKTIDTLGTYLDGRELKILEYQDPAELLRIPYEFEDKVSLYDNILEIHPAIKQKEIELREMKIAELTKLLDKSVEERLKFYGDVIMAIISSKNCIYNIIRSYGNMLLDDIRLTIESLIPADQNYILHGLDAFTNDEHVISFLNDFIEGHKGEWIGEEAKKYLERVESGIKTTGWES